MKSFKSYSKEEHVVEGNIFRAVLQGLKSFGKKIANLLRLPFGKSLVMPVHLPKIMNESQKEQLGKKGGEVSECAFAIRLRDLLMKENWAMPPIVVEIPSPGVERQMDVHQYVKKQISDYLQQEKGTGRKELKNWKATGYASAQAVHDQMLKRIKGATELFAPKIGIGGEGLTGYEKADVIVTMTKVDEKNFEEVFKLSLKATSGDPRHEGMDLGLQTSAVGLLYSLATDMSPTEAKSKLKKENQTTLEEIKKSEDEYVTKLKGMMDDFNSAHSEFGDELVRLKDEAYIKKQEFTKRQNENVKSGKEMYRDGDKDQKKRIQGAIDQARDSKKQSAGDWKKYYDQYKADVKKLKTEKDEAYKLFKEKLQTVKSTAKALKDEYYGNGKMTTASRYHNELIKIYKENGIDTTTYDDHGEMLEAMYEYHGRGFTKTERFQNYTRPFLIDHMKNVQAVMENRYAKDPEGMIKRLLNLGGIEKGLDYIKGGFRDGKPTEGTLVHHTLDNDMYHNTIEKIFSKDIMRGMQLKFESLKRNIPELKISLYSSVEEKEVFAFFTRVKGSAMGNISLPQIDTGDGKYEGWIQYVEKLHAETHEKK